MGRHTYISDMIKGIYYADKSVVDTVHQLPPSTQIVPIITLYGKIGTNFKKIGYSCGLCRKMWQQETLNLRHPYVCKKLKKKTLKCQPLLGR